MEKYQLLKLGIIESDPWLEPYSAAIEGRHQHALDKNWN